jgi:hypothetical protein
VRVAVSLLLLVALCVAAAAQNPRAAAEASLRKGRNLLRLGKVREACDAFEESQRLDAQSSTLFALAACHEKVGKITSAWLAYREVAARDGNRDRRRRANELATKLASKVPKLFLELDHELPGLAVTLSGKDITEHVGMDIPVDPGAYTVVVSATNYKQSSRDVQLGPDGKVTTIQFALEAVDPSAPADKAPDKVAVTPVDKPAEAAVADKPVAAAPIVDKPVVDPPAVVARLQRKTYAKIALAAGGVALGASVIVGISARSKWNDARQICGGSDTCSNQSDLDRANAVAHQATTRGDLATGFGIGGALIAAGGVWLWITAPDGSGTTVVPSVTASSAGVSMSGRF